MKKILNIISSPRGTASYSIRLADAILEKIQTLYPGSSIVTTDLAKQNFPHLEEAHLTSFFTPADKHTEKDKAAIRHSNDAIKDLKDADIIVIGAPMYNFGMASTLKAWIDHIVRAGVTFSYSEKGAEGLLKGKKVYIALASGGVYSEGPMKVNDFVDPYLRFILGFIGMTDITTFRVEGTSIPGIQDTAWEKALAAVSIQ
jgi:FMN-dependent NADH-azoreductase